MKQFKRFFLFLMVVFTLTACDKSERFGRDEFIDVVFKVDKKNLPLTSETPLTKSSDGVVMAMTSNFEAKTNRGIFGINIYEYQGEHPSDNPFCYGFFDSYENFDNIVIKFRRGYKYQIVIDYVPNGKDIFGFDGIDYGVPFHRAMHVPHDAPPKFNQLFYDVKDCLMGLGSTEVHLAPEVLQGDFSKGQFERYIYLDWDFEPPTNGESIQIELLKANAGLTFIFEKVEGFDYSKIDVQVATIKNTVDLTKTNTLTIPQISMGRSYYFENDVCEYENLKLMIGTSKNVLEIFNGEVEIKRNTMRTYTVKLKPEDTSDSPVDIVLDNEQMGNEENGVIN